MIYIGIDVAKDKHDCFIPGEYIFNTLCAKFLIISVTSVSDSLRSRHKLLQGKIPH